MESTLSNRLTEENEMKAIIGIRAIDKNISSGVSGPSARGMIPIYYKGVVSQANDMFLSHGLLRPCISDF